MTISRIAGAETLPRTRYTAADATVTILPMTFEQVGEEVMNVGEVSARVQSLKDAFATFKPVIRFRAQAGSPANPVDKELAFGSLADFEPARIRESLGALSNDALEAVFRLLRPVERSYRLVQLFFAHADAGRKSGISTCDLIVLNGDTQAITDSPGSPTLQALATLLKSRNDSDQFRDSIGCVVVPGYLSGGARNRIETMLREWNTLFLTDLADEPNFRRLKDALPGKYDFLSQPTAAESNTLFFANWIKLRDAHAFELDDSGASPGAGLFGPASLPVAGLVLQTDRAVGAGTTDVPRALKFGELRGTDKARIEPRPGQLGDLITARELVVVVRNENNELWAVGVGAETANPLGLVRYFTPFRILRLLQREIERLLQRLAGKQLTAEFVAANVQAPINAMLGDAMRSGIVTKYDARAGVDEARLAAGQLDVTIEVQPAGTSDVYSISVT